MNRSCSLVFQFGIALLLLLTFPSITWGAEPRVQIRSPQDGSHVTQEQEYVLVSGKVASEAVRSSLVDIFLVLDVSLSTAQYAGVDFPELAELPNFYLHTGKRRLRSAFLGPLRNSLFAAQIVASRRLLSHLDPETTRVGVITFAWDAWLKQPLTHDFEKVRSVLDSIYASGPSGGTNTADALRLATQELLGTGEGEKYLDSIKALFLLTDGMPTRPTGDGRSGNRADEGLALNAAQLAREAGVKVQVFGLGKKARTAVGIAKESGGTYTLVTRPADLLGVLDGVSVVGVEFVQVTNETMGQKALRSRLAPDGFFASAVPVVAGLNRIQVLARASNGLVGRDTITLNYQPGKERSLDLEIFLEREKRSLDLKIFLEKEKSLEVAVERPGTSPDQVQTEIDGNR